jgi:hypothetical protein
LNFCTELRPTIRGTLLWETSTLLVVAFATGYSYLFVVLSRYLGIRSTASAIRASHLPLVYIALSGILLITAKTQELENPALALFLSILLVSAIHITLYVAVLFKLPRVNDATSIHGTTNLDLRVFNSAITGIGLTVVGIGVPHILYGARTDLSVVSAIMVSILAIPVIAVRRLIR